MVSKWIEVSTSVWLLRVAWRKGASSSAWKSMARLPLRERTTRVGHPALGTMQPHKHLNFRSDQCPPDPYPMCPPGRAGPSRRRAGGCGKLA